MRCSRTTTASCTVERNTGYGGWAAGFSGKLMAAIIVAAIIGDQYTT